jgi:hypothetical protein
MTMSMGRAARDLAACHATRLLRVMAGGKDLGLARIFRIPRAGL